MKCLFAIGLLYLRQYEMVWPTSRLLTDILFYGAVHFVQLKTLHIYIFVMSALTVHTSGAACTVYIHLWGTQFHLRYFGGVCFILSIIVYISALCPLRITLSVFQFMTSSYSLDIFKLFLCISRSFLVINYCNFLIKSVPVHFVLHYAGKGVTWWIWTETFNVDDYLEW